MNPGFTMAEAATRERQIKMRKERVIHLNREVERILDCMRIIEEEISELERME